MSSAVHKDEYKQLLVDNEQMEETVLEYPEEEKALFTKNPYDHANIFSKILFFWVSPVIKFGQRNTFDSKTLGDPCKEIRADLIKNNLLTNWNRFKDTSDNAILRAVWSTYWKEFIVAFFYQFIKCCILISKPLIITLILEYIEDPKGEDGGVYYGLGLVLSFVLIGVVENIITEQFNFNQRILGEKAKYALIGIIYDKAFTLSSATNKIFSQGEIINFINVDVEEIPNLTILLPMIAGFPIQFGFSIVLLYFYFGISLFGSLGMGFFISFIVFIISKIKAEIQIKMLREKDKRMRATTEVVDNIKAIKLNSWADIFLHKITKIRNYEIFLTKLGFIFASLNICFRRLVTPALVITILAIFFAMGNSIKPSRAFGGIQILKTLEIPLKWIPDFISSYLECRVSMNRIQRFLRCSEINPRLVESNSEELQKSGIDILVKNANFTWGGHKEKYDNKEENKEVNKEEEKEQTVANNILLKDLSLTVFKGEFVCIIGEVCAGKSSLFHALIGDMIYIDPQTAEELSYDILDEKIRELLCERSALSQHIVKFGGSVGLVQQTPWIQNMTIRDNILFGLPLEEDRYKRVIEACQLESDFMILKGGDLTEIGEKGINLSGGQKARISLARAVYSNCDILLMDDPISALDANVKQKVFEKVFCGELKHKTRVLVTHAIDFLHLADRIIVMEKGKIKYIGTYNELKHSNEIKNVIETIAKTNIKNKSEDNNDIIDEDAGPSIQRNKDGRSILSSSRANITEDENKELIIVGPRTYLKILFEYRSWIIYLLAIICLFIFSYFSVNTTLSYGKWIRNSKDNKYMEHLITCIIYTCGICIFITLAIFLIFVSSVQKSRIIHSKMIEKTVNAPVNLYFDKTPSGKILNRFAVDISVIDIEIGRNIMWCFDLFVSTFVDIYVAALSSLWLLVIVPILFVAAYILQKQFTKLYKDLARLKSVQNSPLINHFGETLWGMSTIRAFSITKIDPFNILMKDQIDSEMMGNLFFNFLYFNVEIMFGSLILTDLESNMTSYVRCLKIFDIPQEDQAPFDSSLESWPEDGKIEFVNYSLRYRPETELVLNNLNFTIEPKAKIGVVGRTGAGKSTICLALCRIVEADFGQIFIDGIDISTISLKNLRENIAIIPQDPTLFEGTLRFNLDPNNQHTDQELLDVLRQASLEYLIDREEHGINQMIEEKGQNLSSGEKQLICICRAIIKKSKIVLMDEATANIDIKTEELIQQQMHQNFEDATVITIAHRLNTVYNSDKVLVLDKGKVVEYDNPQVLLENKQSIFYSYVQKLNMHNQ